MTQTLPVRILFLGTPDFAVPSLAALHEQGAAHGWQVVGVGTQPDRPAGRGKQLAIAPVKQYALAHGLPVLQPSSLRKDPAAVEALAALAPDLIVVAAYGLILPSSVLSLPTFGCINVHASLLPAYRGASPITAAILDGRDETGVTIMLMDEGMDTGPSLRQARESIRPDDTTASLSARLAALGASLLVETLRQWLAGALVPTPQSELEGEPSACRLIRKEAGRIDWSRPAVEIERMVRAYTPWPSAYTAWRGEVFKVLAAGVIPGRADPGSVVSTPAGPAVGTGEGLLLLKTVQAAGKRAVPASAFANGAAGFVGGEFG
jgi:methionyl-tRNA formyltransferase